MAESESVNVDNSVLVNYLYSTILSEATGGDAEFEHNNGCREYFESSNIYIVAGGKAVGEFENLCERRQMLYKNIEDFIIETDEDIFEYPFGWGDEKDNPNDPKHLRKGVKMNMYMHESKAEQLSVIRRCFQQMGECKRIILDSEIDETFDQFHNSSLSREIDSELDINHDADVLVDAAYIDMKHGISILAALDSDITTDRHESVFLDIVRDVLAPDIEVETIDPQDFSPENLLN